MKYSTTLYNNSFIANTAGMKGTAINIKEVSIVNITNNHIERNAPVNSFFELLRSPYVKYFTYY